MFASRTNWRLDQNRIARAVEDHQRSGKELFDLTISNPTSCGLSYPENEIREALSNPRALEYHPDSKGLLEAREAVSRYYDGRRSLSGGQRQVEPGHIVLSSGTSEAYSNILRLLCEVGDEVLVPAPSYPLFEFLADLADIRLVPYTLVYDYGWQIEFTSLLAALSPRSRALLVVHPNNPTGSLVKPGEAAELATICGDRKMAIIADEVFLDYAIGNGSAATFALDDSCLTFTLSGLSKISLLPQMKLAWTILSGPADLRDTALERLEVIADTYLSASTPIQLAAAKFLDLRFGMQQELQARIDANLAMLDAALDNAQSVERLAREAGWYAVLRVPVTGSDEDLAVTLLEKCDVYVHPGHFFNFPKDGYLVLSLITPPAMFEKGVNRLLRLFAD
jgi:aspartate/methionine/tyrosine aminotransferase